MAPTKKTTKTAAKKSSASNVTKISTVTDGLEARLKDLEERVDALEANDLGEQLRTGVKGARKGLDEWLADVPLQKVGIIVAAVVVLLLIFF